mmetsp:Transcript_27170/g.84522  ORF Transcript_27170/g.84522 Transcript_27170/m.84522 type:complete len:330 (+) Transcript_27170:887-1876(+)
MSWLMALTINAKRSWVPKKCSALTMFRQRYKVYVMSAACIQLWNFTSVGLPWLLLTASVKLRQRAMDSMPTELLVVLLPCTVGPPHINKRPVQSVNRCFSVISGTWKSQRSIASRGIPSSSSCFHAHSICSKQPWTLPSGVASCVASVTCATVKSCSSARWSSSRCSKSSMGILRAVISLKAASFLSTLAMSFVSSAKPVPPSSTLPQSSSSSSSLSLPHIFFTELKIWPAIDCTTLKRRSRGRSTILPTECVTSDADVNMIKMMAVISRQLVMESTRLGCVKLKNTSALRLPSGAFFFMEKRSCLRAGTMSDRVTTWTMPAALVQWTS